MAWWRLLFTTTNSRHKSPITTTLLLNPNPKPHFFSTSFLITKTPRHLRKKKHKPSPRTNPIQPSPSLLLPHFESILTRDTSFRFLTRTKSYLSKLPDPVLPFDAASKLHRELGFPRGRKLLKSLLRHPLLFHTYRHSDNKLWFGFSPLMDSLLLQENSIMNSMESQRITTVRKLLMMSSKKRISLAKLHHCRSLFGLPDDFRDRALKYRNYFRVGTGEDGNRFLELVNWDPLLAVSELEREFVIDEERVKRAFNFPVKHGKSLDLEMDEIRKLNLRNTLPLVSPYSDGWKLDNWTLEAEKYRVGVIHEFLSLTLEKRAYIHHIVEFKEELSLTKHTYQMLLRQPRTFYLAGTEMNWAVFLRDAYGEDGVLINKEDPQMVFNEKLYRYAEMQEMEPGSEILEE